MQLFSYLCIHIDRGVEQLVARRAHNPKVVGSSPAPATQPKKPSSSDGFFCMRLLRSRLYAQDPKV